MDIRIIKGCRENIRDCEEALLKSDLGRYYFSGAGSARKAIEEGIDNEHYM